MSLGIYPVGGHAIIIANTLTTQETTRDDRIGLHPTVAAFLVPPFISFPPTLVRTCKLPCLVCNLVQHRLREPKKALVSEEVQVSAVAQHAVDEGQEIAWSSATVIDGHPNFHQRFIYTRSMAHQIPRQTYI